MPPDRDRLMRAALTRTVPNAAFSPEGLARWMAAAAQTPAPAPAADGSAPRLSAPGFAGDGDRFTAGAMLGTGATGQVWALVDRDLDRSVAVKVLGRDGGAEEVRSFIDEARITASLSHPNVLPVHDLGRDADGRAFFSMKRIDGRSLADAIDGSIAAKRLPPLADLNATVSVFIAVCQALAYAHHRQVVHQDVKPANIMLGAFGEVLLVDWGSAARLDGSVPPRLYGTPLYMSPEQARSERVDPRSDVYAVGATLFHALFLRPPTWDDDPERFFALKRAGVIQPPDRDERRGVPAALVGVAMKAMAPAADDRYRDADTLLADLRAYQAGLAVSAHREALRERLARWHRRHAKALWPAAAALAAVLALGVALYGERLARIARWGAPIVTETFDDDGWRTRWKPWEGAFERRDGRLVSVDPSGSVVVLDRKLWGAVAIEYDGEFLPGAHPCDLSAIWCRDVERSADGARIEHLVDAYWFQFGANNGVYSTITTDGYHQLACAYVQPEPGRRHAIRCEIVDDRLTLAVDGRPICEWVDPFRFEGGYVALYGFYPGKAFDNVRVSVRGVARSVPATAVGDALWREGQFALAAQQYDRVADSWPGDSLGDEALYKAGLCRWRLDRRDEADAVWAQLRGRPNADLARLQQLDRPYEAGDHAAVVAALAEICAGASPETRRRATMRWTAWVRELIDRGDRPALERYLALHDRALADDPVCDGMAAMALSALGRDAEVEARFPRQRLVCADALAHLGRWREIFDRYPEQLWHRAEACAQIGEFDLVDLDLFPHLKGDVLLARGRPEEALHAPGVSRRTSVDALLALGRLDEALARAENDGPWRACVLIHLGEARAALEHALPGESDRGEAEALARIALGDARQACDLAPSSDAGASGASLLAIEALLAGDRAEADRWLARCTGGRLAPVFTLRLLAPFVRAVGDGRWDAFDAACRDALAQRWEFGQRIWWDARRLLGEVDDRAFLAQPYRLRIDATLLVLQAMSAERHGDGAAAAAAWRAWLALPTWRRTLWPDPALAAVAASRVAALAR